VVVIAAMHLRIARFVALAILALAASACAPREMTWTKITSPPLPGTDGAAHGIEPSASAQFTVVVFFANHCPCQAAHDPRLRDLYTTYHPRGIDLLIVDSELGASVERDNTEVVNRGYPFPIVIDRGGVLAHRVGAEYATETFVLDRFGNVRYHGGIDSDKHALHDDATPYLQNALDDLLAGVPLRRVESKALGCALQTW
jgi:hypothetical protein